MQSSRRATFGRPLAAIAAFAMLSGMTVAGPPPAAADATITVTTTLDEFEDPGPGAGCSLREAIRSANSDTAFGGCEAGDGDDTIQLDAATYTLTRAGQNEDATATGDLDILAGMGALTIEGQGRDATIINGNDLDRVFHIIGGVSVEMRDLTVRDGSVTAAGGGIYNEGALELLRVRIVSNNGTMGGGIWNFLGAGTASTTLIDSLVDGNEATSSGGGITNASNAQELTLIGSTVSGNKAGQHGGGVSNNCLGATVWVVNSTISGNEAREHGGGINSCSSTFLSNVTIVDNTADSDEGGSAGDGGGVHRSSGTVTVRNTIIAGNVDTGGEAPDCSTGVGGNSLTSAGYNLVGDTEGCPIDGDLTGNLTDQDPLLEELGGYGGLTPTHRPLPESPAVDGANPAGCSDHDDEPITTGQRGVPRPQPDGGTCDIGAVELDFTPPSAPALTGGVANAFQKQTSFSVGWGGSVDEGAGLGSYDVSLRSAAWNANLGDPAPWQEDAGPGEEVFAGATGNTYCFDATATDLEGNESDPTTVCTAVPLNNKQLSHAKGFAKKTGSGYYLNSFSQAKQKGSKLTKKNVKAKRLALLVTKCPKCGVIKVFWKGKLIKKINLKASKTKKKQEVAIKTFGGTQTGTLQVVVASKGKVVRIEGLGVLAA